MPPAGVACLEEVDAAVAERSPDDGWLGRSKIGWREQELLLTVG